LRMRMMAADGGCISLCHHTRRRYAVFTVIVPLMPL
jgi:hypothetical protein